MNFVDLGRNVHLRIISFVHVEGGGQQHYLSLLSCVCHGLRVRVVDYRHEVGAVEGETQQGMTRREARQAEVVEEEDLLPRVLRNVQRHFMTLEKIIRDSGEACEGNVLLMHHSFTPNPKNEAKQHNLVTLAASLPLEGANIVEIGFNAGHSSLLMLAAHPTVRILAFDLGEHAYTIPCYEALSSAFPGRIELILGRSQRTLPDYARTRGGCIADLLHIDGDHSPAGAKADLQNAAMLARPGAWVVFDDVCFSPLKAVWNEAHRNGLVDDGMWESQHEVLGLQPTNRHGISTYVRSKVKGSHELVSEVEPILSHRGRMRHVLVLAPTDHGQDSLLGYLTKHRLFQGGVSTSKRLTPQTTERHQSPWLSLPLRYQSEICPMPSMVHLVAPPFYDQEMIQQCFPLVEGVLAVVDCAEGLTPSFCESFRAAVEYGLHPVLLMNKLDKLQALEPDDEMCFQRLQGIITDLNGMMEGSAAPPLSVLHGNVVFGRGSLSVAESIGGWGFTLSSWSAMIAARRVDIRARRIESTTALGRPLLSQREMEEDKSAQ